MINKKVSTMQPIKLYWCGFAPNPAKVVIILEELGLRYQSENVAYGDVKEPYFVNINPNGRIPAITDPNTNLTIWESGAIIAYLVETYDKEEKITYSSFPERFELKQWAFFQASGQGPYFGQAAWFNIHHHEKLPSAQARYGIEVKRIVGVLNNVLKDKNWLVGDKCTYADLSFFMMNNNIEYCLRGGPVEWDIKEFPEYERWMNAMKKRPSVVKTLATLYATEVNDKELETKDTNHGEETAH